ncbi:adenosylcobinamide-phosphate synthase CbiB [Cohaesibacter intestini]|uniref:adenosylcobinamide-phosphate synthase CbiB n=1 Tax=Cohaesibacter intestini TaxID=2211145 RepID=UPI001FE08794|nr:adenosylcobinamide-phosphate synthase CbiB [Cohaesibacter intestini]
MIAFGPEILLVLLVALAIDALLGEPNWVWERFPHPVVWFGKAIGLCDRLFNHPSEQSPFVGRLTGLMVIIVLFAGGTALAWFLQESLLSLGIFGGIVLALVSSVLIAQKSLYDHVLAVQKPLEDGDIIAARQAVSMIVGRETKFLEKDGVARAAIESLAENFSDGIVAPVFWFALFGFPGLVAYKIVNTADSMIGHKNDRYLWFGWASARLDDLLNLMPARLTMLLLLLSPFHPVGGRAAMGVGAVWAAIKRDAPKHRSPNAGWPESATAGRLDIALSGPRYYGSKLVDEPFVNDGGRVDIGPVEVGDALRLYRSSLIVQFLAIAAIAGFCLL